MEHMKKINLKEKKLNLKEDIDVDNISNKEMSTEHIDEVLQINNEILEVFKNHKCTVNQSYMILASMLESIYAYSILKDFGYVEK